MQRCPWERVPIQRIQTVLDFRQVVDAVAITVRTVELRAQNKFRYVEQTVGIGVRTRVRPHDDERHIEILAGRRGRELGDSCVQCVDVQDPLAVRGIGEEDPLGAQRSTIG